MNSSDDTSGAGTLPAAVYSRLNHRYKNYQQMVASLISLQIRRAASPEARAALEDLRARIDAAATMQAELDPGSGPVEMEPYLSRIAARISQGYDGAGRYPLSLDLASVALSARQANLLGQILAELMINCYRHAFVDGGAARITLRALPDGRLEMRVADDGPGAKETPAPVPGGPAKLGLALSNNLARSLGGTLRRGDPPGFSVAIVFTPDDMQGA